MNRAQTLTHPDLDGQHNLLLPDGILECRKQTALGQALLIQWIRRCDYLWKRIILEDQYFDLEVPGVEQLWEQQKQFPDVDLIDSFFSWSAQLDCQEPPFPYLQLDYLGRTAGFVVVEKTPSGNEIRFCRSSQVFLIEIKNFWIATKTLEEVRRWSMNSQK